MAERTSGAPRHLQIKKYPNRRYYDATHSRHLTLSQIRSLIQQGCEVTITDGKTGADITAQVLTQIILEMETAKLDSFPVPLLVRVIRLNDQLVKDFIDKYFNQALESFLIYQQQIEDQIRRTHGLPASFPSVSAWTKAVLAPFAPPLVNPAVEKSSELFQTRGAADQTKELHRMVRKLQSQVATLKKSKARLKAQKARHRGR